MKNILTKSRTILEWTHISELNQSQLSQLTDTIVGWAGLKEELHQTHLLTAEQGAHDLPAENEGKSGPLVNKSAWEHCCEEITAAVWVLIQWWSKVIISQVTQLKPYRNNKEFKIKNTRVNSFLNDYMGIPLLHRRVWATSVFASHLSVKFLCHESQC